MSFNAFCLPVIHARQVKEVKKEAFTLPQDVVDMYLRDAEDFVIDPAPTDTPYVSRKFISLRFGGNEQHFIARFKPADGSRAVVFPQADLNPFLPMRPGAAGLIFASRREVTEGPWSLFCKDKPSGEAVWRYMGDYENHICGRPTPEQFQRQTPEVRAVFAHLQTSYLHEMHVGQAAVGEAHPGLEEVGGVRRHARADRTPTRRSTHRGRGRSPRDEENMRQEGHPTDRGGYHRGAQ